MAFLLCVCVHGELVFQSVFCILQLEGERPACKLLVHLCFFDQLAY